MPDSITRDITEQVTEKIQRLSNADRWWALAQLLESCPDWNHTPEGNNYWQCVRDKMLANSKGPRLLQAVYTKEEVAVNGVLIKAHARGHIEKLDPIYIQFDCMPSLLFPIPLDKLSLR